MGEKKVTSLRLDADVVKRAKELGLNMSVICERALKEAISRLEGKGE